MTLLRCQHTAVVTVLAPLSMLPESNHSLRDGNTFVTKTCGIRKGSTPSHCLQRLRPQASVPRSLISLYCRSRKLMFVRTRHCQRCDCHLL